MLTHVVEHMATKEDIAHLDRRIDFLDAKIDRIDAKLMKFEDSEIDKRLQLETLPWSSPMETRNNALFQEQRRNKLQDALRGIPALAMDEERRIELKSKLDELSTGELERLLLFSAQRVGRRQNR